MKLSDYIVGQLADWGVRHIFLVTGGGAMHLNDSIGKEPRIQYVCNHHEQASAMAAEGYARISGQPGVVNVTTGPGGINALNGVFGAWTDSVPMLIISGQVKRETCMRAQGITGLRQLGDQEVDIVAMVEKITKYAVMVDDPLSIRYHLERGWHLAQSGRPGPCWLDIPVDVQAASIEPASLRGYDPAEDEPARNKTAGDDSNRLTSYCHEVLQRIRGAKRPVILAGTGIRAAHAVSEFDQLCHRLGIPVTTAWSNDLIASDDPLFCGRQGTIGDRAGNFTVQNADVLLILGSRLAIRQTSYNWQSFAPRAFKIQVDIDTAEFHKPTVQPNLSIHCDLKRFLAELLRECDSANYERDTHTHASWLAWCRERVRRYPVVQDRQRQPWAAFEPVLLHRATVSQTRRQRCHHLRQCELLHRPFSDDAFAEEPTSYLQLRFRFHGLRPAGRHRSGFRPSRRACHLHCGGWQHSNEHTGVTNYRSPPLAAEDICTK